MIPIAAAAPFAEKSSAIMTRSRMLKTNTTASWLKLELTANEYTKDAAAYEHAMAFDTKKYLYICRGNKELGSLFDTKAILRIL